MQFDFNPPIFPATWATAWGEDRYGYWQAFEVKGVSQVMRWIVPGTFLMGSPESEVGRRGNETQHEVILSKGYWLADGACTQELWRTVMGGNPSEFQDDLQNPVEQVSWYDCQNFIQKINKALRDELTLRLPSEAEWEYACRVGADKVFSFGGDLGSKQANFHGGYPYGDMVKGEYKERTVPVYSYSPNSWGLWQMHGNVWEWCQDRWSKYPEELVIDPKGEREHVRPGRRLLRGGSWVDHGRLLRSASRYVLSPDYHLAYLGFRLAGG